jgi:diaminohydroxyphosphoribosylaminopyrimidine deaminase/5-amino-6-(5-phosphoribosylamino)uracil reductase
VVNQTSAETWIFVTDRAPEERTEALSRKPGVEVIALESSVESQRVPLCSVLDVMYARGLLRVLVEGGSEVHGSFFDKRLVDEVVFFTAPKIIGGSDARPAVGGTGVGNVAESLQLTSVSVTKVGSDRMTRAYAEGRAPMDVYRNR